MKIEEARDFPFLGWRLVHDEAGDWWQAMAPLSVVGDVRPSKLPDHTGQFWWNARTMLWSRKEDDKTPTGYAATLEEAKAIVECILFNTRTCSRPEAKKNA
jgi:hypothetical protein